MFLVTFISCSCLPALSKEMYLLFFSVLKYCVYCWSKIQTLYITLCIQNRIYRCSCTCFLHLVLPSFITFLSMLFLHLKIYNKNLICLSGDGQREPDLAPLQGQRLQAGGSRSGIALIRDIERSHLSLVLQTPEKSFRRYSLPRVV